MRPELERRGVRIVTVSAEAPDEIRAGRHKHELAATMLADRELVVTDRFGLRNRGFHSGPPGSAKALPVPTSLLVDAEGRVRWKDQSENYQRRSDPEFVLAAVSRHLADGASA